MTESRIHFSAAPSQLLQLPRPPLSFGESARVVEPVANFTVEQARAFVICDVGASTTRGHSVDVD
ncbi:MAG: hypothetical protein CBC48_02565 [bacterium TMED88]|nr:hypothetical protein [Deltaproteobacteria bacterium]OUV36237.1 MAG: hypothetical protein CBC48_02565 [bacterium TMED88]